MDDDECIHGLTPSTCSLCRARNAPKAVKPMPAPRRASTPRAAGSPRAATPKRPTTVVSTGKVAGRSYFFGDGERGVWWIDQTDRYDDEWSEGVVRSERPVGAVAVPAASRNVGEIREGDLTLHIVKGEIVGIGVATGDGRAVTGPPTGWLAEVMLELLDEPVEVRPLASEYKPGPPHPFTNQGFTQPGVCFPYPPAVAERLARKVLAARLPACAPADWTALTS